MAQRQSAQNLSQRRTLPETLNQPWGFLTPSLTMANPAGAIHNQAAVERLSCSRPDQ